MPNFLSFKIQNFKGIECVEIDIKNKTLMPIVGINESGKTTILKAIKCLSDYSKISKQEKYHNINNSSKLKSNISAKISFNKEMLKGIVQTSFKVNKKEGSRDTQWYPSVEKQKANESGEIIFDINIVIDVQRNNEIKHEISIFTSETSDDAEKSKIMKAIFDGIMSKMPSILYLDTFKNEKFFEKIVVNQKSDSEALPNITQVIEKYNQEKNKNYDIYSIKEDSEIKTFNDSISRYLTENISTPWKEFFKSEKTIGVDFEFRKKARAGMGEIQMNIYEEANDEKRIFTIQERSQGFSWFFNYILDTKFSKYTTEQGGRRLFLLDEPGAYLHPSAQEEFCNKLKELSKDDIVIYTTHSPYMINPQYIARNNIVIAERDENGTITTIKATEKNIEHNKGYKAVADAMQINNSFIFDIKEKKLLVVEGYQDFCAIMSVCKEEIDKQKIAIVCSGGAEKKDIDPTISLIHNLSLPWIAIFDNDKAGKNGYERFSKMLDCNQNLIKRHLYILDSKDYTTKDNDFEIHHLFDEEDRKKIGNTNGIKNTIVDFYYNKKERTEYNFHQNTIKNFKKLIDKVIELYKNQNNE